MLRMTFPDTSDISVKKLETPLCDVDSLDWRLVSERDDVKIVRADCPVCGTAWLASEHDGEFSDRFYKDDGGWAHCSCGRRAYVNYSVSSPITSRRIRPVKSEFFCSSCDSHLPYGEW